jgi:hypothetical protein
MFFGMFKNYLFKNNYFFRIATELTSAHINSLLVQIHLTFSSQISPKKRFWENLNYKTHFEVINFIFLGIKDNRYIYTFAISLFF